MLAKIEESVSPIVALRILEDLYQENQEVVVVALAVIEELLGLLELLEFLEENNRQQRIRKLLRPSGHLVK